jgi:hypothetical protein
MRHVIISYLSLCFNVPVVVWVVMLYNFTSLMKHRVVKAIKIEHYPIASGELADDRLIASVAPEEGKPPTSA